MALPPHYFKFIYETLVGETSVKGSFIHIGIFWVPAVCKHAILKMEAAEMLRTYQIIRCHNPECHSTNPHRCEDVRSYHICFCYVILHSVKVNNVRYTRHDSP
jgi:hypothetical protein